MSKQLLAKLLLIGALILFALIVLYPPSQTLRGGIDILGGTSLIYEIDTTGMTLEDRKDLSVRMIDVLRRRVDPGNIRNLVWRPQGDTRFEIQMPLASNEVRLKRQNYENAMSSLLADNINPALILQALNLPVEKRTELFKKITSDDPNKIVILDALAKAHDDYYKLRNESDQLNKNLKEMEVKITAAGLDANQVITQRYSWSMLDETKRQSQFRTFVSPADPNKADTAKIELLNQYIKTFSVWTPLSKQLTDPNTIAVAEFKNSQKQIDKLNLTEERISTILAIDNKYARQEQLDKLKKEFSSRDKKIDAVAETWLEYKPFQGRLDDPKDLQRMLKGAGILEFRILPTQSTNEMDKILPYIDRLRANGPSYASATERDYVWCQVEKIDELMRPDTTGTIPIQNLIRWRDAKNAPVFAEKFGDKWYVLASNKTGEDLLYNPQNPWKLVKSNPTRDQEGKRAIGFELDSKGGGTFAQITGNNIGRPLCILLDNLALSAPNIKSQIYTSGIIEGTFTDAEVTDMVNKLNAGSLPARLIEPPISERTIGPSIGADNLHKGIRSGLIGVAAVILGMAIYYTIGGAIADAAMLLNLLFTLAIMAFLNATFTLPGIVSLVLTIGMSVDANVLIFERMREEFAKGSSMRTALKNGYEKAFSAIFDSNLTTVISAVVLYWVGSEDIKGFAIVLILGLASNLFTAVFATRAVFDLLIAKGILKEKMLMLQLIKRPKVNWMSYRPLFFTISGILVIGGLVTFFTRDNTKSNKYDIEFTGGTSVVINVKPDVQLTRQDVENKIKQIGNSLNNPALASSSVWSVGAARGQKGNERVFSQYEITTTETNKSLVTIAFPADKVITLKDVISKITERLSDADITAAGQANSFNISSAQTNTVYISNLIKQAFPEATISNTQVQQTVNDAVIKAFSSDMQILQNLVPNITSVTKIDDKLIETEPQLANYIGGIKVAFTTSLPATGAEIASRTRDLAFKPDTQDLVLYDFRLLSSDLTELPENKEANSFVFVSTNPDFAFRQPSAEEWKKYEDNERARVTSACQLAETLPRVTQISPSVGSEAKMRAVLAIILSLIAMLIYIWFRFANLRYGLGAVITLFHDTCVTIGVITSAYYISQTSIGQALLVGDFKINLTMIAAVLTLIGYSINDTIVIYDRIREFRKRGLLTPQLINDSINDCMSRTILTGSTTLAVVWIMYIFGGEGLRGFNYTMGLGIIIGTYSSIAISAPVLLFGKAGKQDQNKPKA